MNFISLFSGIGGLDYGFTKAGWECVGWCELDKFAHKAYSILHDPKGLISNEYDVRHIDKKFIEEIEKKNGKIDAIIGGFPCQSFSIAGKRQGFNDLTRGTLFFEIARIAQIAKPRYIILENVKGLCNHDRGRTFEIVLSAMDELGYDVEWQILNSKNFGVPQNRERVFIVASARGSSRSKIFPISRENNATIKVVGMLDIKGNEQVRRVYSTDYLSPTLSTMQGGNREPKIIVLGNTSKTGHNSENIHDIKGICTTLNSRDYKGAKQIAIPVLTPDRLEKRQNGRRFKENGDPSFTLTALDRHGVLIENREKKDLIKNFCIRKLTPLECFRLQSYPDEWYHTLKENGFSDTQLYKMAGNGVTSNVAYEIAMRLKGEKNDTTDNEINN